MGICDGMITVRASISKRLWTAGSAVFTYRLRAAQASGREAGGVAAFRDFRRDGLRFNPTTCAGWSDGSDRCPVLGSGGRVDDTERAARLCRSHGLAGVDGVSDF